MHHEQSFIYYFFFMLGFGCTGKENKDYNKKKSVAIVRHFEKSVLSRESMWYTLNLTMSGVMD